MQKAIFVTSAVILVSTLLACAAFAQTGLFFDEFGVGPKATAMGQAFTAVADDASAAYYNPAGLVQARGIFDLTVGYSYGKPKVSATFADQPDWNVDEALAIRGLYVGIASDLDIDSLIEVHPWLEPFAFGIAAWTNLPEINQYHTPPSFRSPYFLRYKERFQLFSLAVSLAYEITPGLSVGAGILPQVTSTSVQNSFEALNKVDDPVRGLRLSIDQTAELVAVPVAGVLFTPTWPGLRERFSGALTLGLSFRGEMKSYHGRGPLNLGFGLETEEGHFIPIFVIPEVQVVNLVSFNPRQLSLGAALRLGETFTVSTEATWKDYSDYEYFMGLKPTPAFRDTFVARVGVEKVFRPDELPMVTDRIDTLAARVGYYWEPTPVRDMSGPFNILDTNQHVLSAGLAVAFRFWGVDHAFEGFFQVHVLETRWIENHEDPVFGPVEIDGEVFSLGLNYRIHL